MAESTTEASTAPVSGADLKRADEFAREPFVLEGEEAAEALAPGTARRRALDAAPVSYTHLTLPTNREV